MDRIVAQGLMHDITPKDIKSATILVVDDVELNRKMLVHSLQAAGYANIATAENGEQALALTYESHPDLVVLDLMMPGMDGFSYCEKVRQDRKFDNMPIIVQTVLEQIENKIRAFKLGASDYVCKPIDPGELVARVGVHLNNKMLTQSLLEYRQNMQIEFEAARRMQERIMPSFQQMQMYERVFNMKIAQYFETSSHLGGDCWGMRALGDDRLAIWMYDFSGHGVTAALNVFRLHTVMQEFIHASGDPGQFLTTLNRHLHALLERHEFCTMFYGVIDTQANCLLYTAAGAQPAHIFSSGGGINTLLERSFPLGSVQEAVYETRFAPFTPGSLLAFYSDGLVETPNAGGEFISEKIIHQAIEPLMRESAGNPATEAVNTLVHLLKTYNKHSVPDDVTINAYWRNQV